MKSINCEINSLDTSDIILKKIFICSKEQRITLGGIRLIDAKKLTYDTVYDHLDPGMLLGDLDTYSNPSSTKFRELLKKLNTLFPELTKEELVYSIEFFISELIPGVSKPDFQFVERMKKEITGTLQKEKVNVENWFNVSKGKLDYTISSINGYIRIADKPFDLYKIIKEVPVNANCPLMFMISEETKEPIIKYSTTVPLSLIQEWTIKESAKLITFNKAESTKSLTFTKNSPKTNKSPTKKIKKDIFKTPKGLFLKIFYKKGIYVSASISKIFPKINFKSTVDPNDNYTFDNLNEYFTLFKPVITNIKRTLRTDISFKETGISSVSFTVKISKPVDLKKLFNVSDKSTIDRANKDYVKYKFKNGTQLDVRLENTGYVAVGHYIKNEKQIVETITNLTKLLDKTVENGSNIVPTKKEGKGKKDFKKLKEQGIAVDVVSCQKSRRPKIYNGSDPVKTYLLNISGSKLTCPKEPYVYPGFTNVNVACCFKRDQRGKEVYKRNTGENISTNEIPDKQILKTILITTDKILDYGRLGVLDHVSNKLLGEKYFRLGVVQDRNSFMNCILTLTGKKLDYFISKLNEKIFITLSDGDLAASGTSLSEFVRELKSGNVNAITLADLVSKVLEINVIIINLEGNQHYFTCENKTNYLKSILVFNRGNEIYEPIVKKVNSSTLQRIFIKEISHVIQLKNKLCIKIIYPYDILSISKLTGKNVKVIKQIVNDFNKVEFVKTDYGILPVAITGPKIGIPTIKKFELLTAQTQVKFLNTLSSRENFFYLTPYQQIINSKGKCVGIVTGANIIIPVLQSSPLPKLQKIFTDLPVGGISNMIYSNKESDLTSRKSNGVNYADSRAKNAVTIDYSQEFYSRFRFTLSGILLNNPGLKQEIINLRDNNSIKQKLLESIVDSIFKKITMITDKEEIVESIPSVRYLCHAITENCSEIDPFCGKNSEGRCLLKISKKLYPVIIKKLTTEIINDNEILNGEIRSNFLGRNNFINYKNQKIIFTENDVKKFLAKKF